MFLPNGHAKADDRFWVQLESGRWPHSFCLNVSQGYWVHLTRIRGGELVSRHRHPAPVQDFVLKGRRQYLEHNREAVLSSYIDPPTGDIRTLEAKNINEEMIALFRNTGSVVYCNEAVNTTGTTDVFDKIEACRGHFGTVGPGADKVKDFIR